MDDKPKMSIVKIEETTVEGFSAEELKALKEMAKDRMAVGRVFGKVKTVVIALAAVVAGWVFLAEQFWQWMKIKLGG